MHHTSSPRARLSLQMIGRLSTSAIAAALLIGTSVQTDLVRAANAQVSGPAGSPADGKTPPTRLVPVGSFNSNHQSQQLVFSPTSDRFAHIDSHGLELWQTQPLRRLAQVASVSGLGIRQVSFSPEGQLNYIDGRTHAWITPGLLHGMGRKADLISPDGRYAVRTGLREDADDFTPQFYNATSDVYDLQEKRSVCQFPPIGTVAKMALTAHWFAVQLAATGPRPPKPLALCEMATGRAFIMPFSDAHSLRPMLDPQGRWLLVRASGTRLFGLPDWQESKLFALPFAQNAFARNTDDPLYPCSELPCGNPDPVQTRELPEGQLHVSPNGSWIASWGNDHSIRLFQGPSVRQVAILAFAPKTQNVNPSAEGRRVVFSANGRWMGVQTGKHLYRVDLQGKPLRLQELTPPEDYFELQDISNDGQNWLVLHRENSSQPSLEGALWRAKL
jgi:hypothetical protein